mmetsp:Transcript_23062/g.67951  ORF Transcript_23062/g.67951 Transcript_23062/m.67951 type:complete len:206 (-) Transcript_23062:46-663(-)
MGATRREKAHGPAPSPRLPICPSGRRPGCGPTPGLKPAARSGLVSGLPNMPGGKPSKAPGGGIIGIVKEADGTDGTPRPWRAVASWWAGAAAAFAAAAPTASAKPLLFRGFRPGSCTGAVLAFGCIAEVGALTEPCWSGSWFPWAKVQSPAMVVSTPSPSCTAPCPWPSPTFGGERAMASSPTAQRKLASISFPAKCERSSPSPP